MIDLELVKKLTVIETNHTLRNEFIQSLTEDRRKYYNENIVQLNEDLIKFVQDFCSDLSRYTREKGDLVLAKTLESIRRKGYDQ